MSLLTREAILASADRPPLRFPVPEWGGDVLIATADAKGRAAYEEETEDLPYELLRAKVVSLFVVDEAGAALFTPEDVAALNAKSGVAVDRVFRAACQHNKLRKQDREDAEKNCAAASGGNSSSGSLATCTALSENCSSGSAPTS